MSRMLDPSWVFANYYPRFVLGYDSIASPLTLLTKKNIERHWGPVQHKAFSEIKVCPMQLAAPYLPRSKVALHCGDGCISRHNRRGIEAGSGRWPSTNGLHESNIKAYGTEVVGL